jgi:hypothetical protein
MSITDTIDFTMVLRDQPNIRPRLTDILEFQFKEANVLGKWDVQQRLIRWGRKKDPRVPHTAVWGDFDILDVGPSHRSEPAPQLFTGR